MSTQVNVHLWEDHIVGEFGTKDVEQALATMVDDASVMHIKRSSDMEWTWDELSTFNPTNDDIRDPKFAVINNQLIKTKYAASVPGENLNLFLFFFGNSKFCTS